MFLLIGNARSVKSLRTDNKPKPVRPKRDQLAVAFGGYKLCGEPWCCLHTPSERFLGQLISLTRLYPSLILMSSCDGRNHLRKSRL
jgi:hypothetical protein